MDQVSRIKELEGKNYSALEIKEKLDIEYGLHAYKMSTIYKHMREAKFTKKTDETKESPGRRPDEQLIVRIRQVLEDEPNFSVRNIARVLNENPSTVHRYLTQYIGLVYKLCYWVPHNLSDSQKVDRQYQSFELKELLEKCKHNSFRNILTGDQSWFTLTYSANGMWLEPDEYPYKYAKDTIGSKKVMLTVIWNPFGFYIIDFLPEGRSFDSSYFIENILIPLESKKSQIWIQSHNRKLYLHLDNSRIHNSKSSLKKTADLGFIRAPQPPYSPDIDPSDFFLFGYVKGKLRGCVFTSLDERKEKIYEILISIDHETLKKVFDEWIDRCDWISLHDGEYYHK